MAGVTVTVHAVSLQFDLFCEETDLERNIKSTLAAVNDLLRQSFPDVIPQLVFEEAKLTASVFPLDPDDLT